MKTRERTYNRRAKLEVLLEHTELEAVRRIARQQHISMSRLARLAILDAFKITGERR